MSRVGNYLLSFVTQVSRIAKEAELKTKFVMPSKS